MKPKHQSLWHDAQLILIIVACGTIVLTCTIYAELNGWWWLLIPAVASFEVMFWAASRPVSKEK